MSRAFLISVLTVFSLALAWADEKPNANLKVQYDKISNYHNTETGEPIQSVNKFILQVAPSMSYFYDPQTYYIDSLEHDPNGKALLRQIEEDSYKEYERTKTDPFEYRKKLGMLRNQRYKCLKDFNAGMITVWDSDMGDKYRYPVEIEDLQWDLTDSVKTVLGYECQLATAVYHGRKWYVWFAPEIAVQDGPWQLCGLPGLIMEAAADDDSYRFVATGLQSCDEPLKDPYEDDKYFITKRIPFLKMKDYSQRNRSAKISAMTGGKVNLKGGADYKGTDDFLETDYHE